ALALYIEGKEKYSIVNNWIIIFTYLILSLSYNGAIRIENLSAGKVFPALIVLLWIIPILSLIQIVITIAKPTFLEFCKIIKALFIINYLIDYTILESKHGPNPSFGDERYEKYHSKNLLVVCIAGILNLVFEIIMFL
ncbi:26186_t:CDS:1, partial [Racocetra persica]